jgi:hypothetical protein
MTSLGEFLGETRPIEKKLAPLKPWQKMPKLSLKIEYRILPSLGCEVRKETHPIEIHEP